MLLLLGVLKHVFPPIGVRPFRQLLVDSLVHRQFVETVAMGRWRGHPSNLMIMNALLEGDVFSQPPEFLLSEKVPLKIWVGYFRSEL